MLKLLIIVSFSCLFQALAAAQTTQPLNDAAPLYLKAAKLLDANDAANIMSPAASNLRYTEYPPFPAEWQQMEAADYAANTEARALAHEARSIEQVTWPKYAVAHSDGIYLNEMRNLTNELGDAALYEHLHGEDAAAIETLRDQLHLANLVEDPADKKLVRLLVGIGMKSLFVNRLEVITSGIVLTKDPADHKNLQVSVARDVIAQLLQEKDAKTAMTEFMQAEEPAGKSLEQPVMDRLMVTCNRFDAEVGMAAMSIACHIYKFEVGHWPQSVDGLRAYLPTLPIDPGGNGEQTLGYVLIKAGLPDGSDRPLVYSRMEAKDGLFYRIDAPAYSFYNKWSATNSDTKGKFGGQFRDVAGWAPTPSEHLTTTTRPLD